MFKWLWGWLNAPARCRALEASAEVSRKKIEELAGERLSYRGAAIALRRKLEQHETSYDVPGLSPGERERLAILSEQCGQIAQAVGKIQRFGWESSSPYGGRINRVALERAIGSVRAIVNLMLDEDDLRLKEVQTWQRTKRAALDKWTLYQATSMPREAQLEMMRSIVESAEERSGVNG